MNKMNRLAAGLAGLLVLAAASSSSTAAAGYRGGGGNRGGGGGGAHVQNARTNVSNNNRNTNVNHNTNVNRNANVNVNRNVDVNVHNGYGGGYDRWGHPVAAVATAAAVTAVAVGTVAATLPPSGCSGVAVGGVSYQRCGATYYQPVYRGGDVQYVVVNPP